jgi:DNA repair protein RadA/Sms
MKEPTANSLELSDTADVAEEKGHQERADDLRLLASYGAGDNEQENSTASYNTTMEPAGVIAAEVEELDIEWAWEKWIPRQFVTFLYGEAGTGKSSFLHYLAACITRGWDLPDGSKQTEPRGVVYISYEEPTASVLTPALRKSGADMSRISILSKVKRDVQSLNEISESDFEIPTDILLLEQEIIRVGASVVLIDPLMSMVNASATTARNQNARQIVRQIEDLASRTGVAVLIVGHLNKGGSKDLMQRAGGSKGFTDIARCVLGMTRSGSNPAETVVWVEKHSLCGGSEPLVFKRSRTDPSLIEFVSGYVPEARAQAEDRKMQETRSRILALLESEPDQLFDAGIVAQRLRLHFDSVRQALKRMTDSAQITRFASGRYQALQKIVIAAEKPVESVTPIVTPKTEDETQILDEQAMLINIVKARNVAAPTEVLDVADMKTTKI